MAFFKFRLPGQAAGETTRNLSNNPAESVETMRRRARYRLIGASVLVVLGVVVFPLLFDTQPRPVATDISVDIPDRASSKPLVEAKLKPLAVDSALDPKEEVLAQSKFGVKAEPNSEQKAELKATAKPEPKSEAKQELGTAVAVAKLETMFVKPEVTKPATQTESTTSAKQSENKVSESKDASARFVVQVGAFADESKAREARSKLEKAGFKTYTHVAETKEGPRTRVRVGPFGQRDEADKIARKIKQLQFQPQVLTL